MIPGIASLIFIPLLSVFFAHLMWAFGSTWPVTDERALARTVIGTRGIDRMPNRFLTFLLALAIFAAGIWVLAMTDPTPNFVLTLGGVVLALVFGARGIAGYLPAWRRLTPEEPFASLDRKFYSPLCLLLALGLAFLVFWRLTQ